MFKKHVSLIGKRVFYVINHECNSTSLSIFLNFSMIKLHLCEFTFGGYRVRNAVQKQLICVIAVMLMASVFFVSTQASAASKTDDIGVEADAAILVEASTGKVLYGKNTDALLGIASMTKMMTEYLVLESIKDKKLSWDQRVPVSKYAAKISQDYGLSNVPLIENQKYTVKELYDAMAIYSANGAAIALAEAVSGSEEGFIKLMNETAKKLNMGESKFVNSTGLSNSLLKGMYPKGTKEEDENLLSARAVATLAYHLIHDYPESLEVAKTPSKMFRQGQQGETKMNNWNKMLPGFSAAYSGVDGLKTGHTDFAGQCFTGTAERNGVRYITVVMNAKENGKSTEAARFSQTKKILDYAFSHFQLKEVVPANGKIKGHETIDVAKGKSKEASVSPKDSVKIITEKGQKDHTKINFKLNDKVVNDQKVVAPIKKGETVAYVSATNSNLKDLGYVGGQTTDSMTPVVTNESVEKAGWFSLAIRSIGNFFSDIWMNAANTVNNWF